MSSFIHELRGWEDRGLSVKKSEHIPHTLFMIFVLLRQADGVTGRW